MNADPIEIQKFSDAAHHWWDINSEFRPLHEINPLRLEWINACASLKGKKVIDVGCGGGILSESMARKGATVTGIDLSESALKVADLHSLESNLKIHYQHIAAEQMAQHQAGEYDVVTCMEMLEHVPDPNSVVNACAKLAKPGGMIFFSTLNRNLRSYLSAIIAAEYLLRLLPKGTHDYTKFITPAELSQSIRAAGLELLSFKGISYNPLIKMYSLNSKVSVNYLVACRRPLEWKIQWRFVQFYLTLMVR